MGRFWVGCADDDDDSMMMMDSRRILGRIYPARFNQGLESMTRSKESNQWVDSGVGFADNDGFWGGFWVESNDYGENH